MKESAIQKSICDYLALRGYFFWRQNNIPASYEKNGQRQFRRMPAYSMNGVSDIILLSNGTAWFLEVKVPNGKQSDAQLVFEANVAEHGARYHVVRSIEDCQKLGL